ncbi:MAG: membrane-bound lytic murein transglycosylase MltF [Pontibacterium sp.]
MLPILRYKKDIAHVLGLLILLSIPAFFGYHGKTQLQEIKEVGTLKLVTRNTPTTYFLDKGEPAGFEYELVKAFTDHIGVELEVMLAPTFSDIFAIIKAEEAHIAAANLTITPQRQKHFSFSPPYLYTGSSLVYRIKQGRPAPKTINDVLGRSLVVPKNSSHAEALKKLQQSHPELQWQESGEHSTLDLLEKVHKREVDFTVMDTVTYDSHSSYFPGLNKSLSLTDAQPLAWMHNKKTDQSLRLAFEVFFKKAETQALIRQLEEKYLKRENQLNFFDTLTFRKHVQTRLKKLKPYFYEAEKNTGIDWQLLAAISYQESHWNPKAVSPTGVRGLMMLTHATAKEVGVTDRTDAEQSIMGGAKYFAKTIRRIPKRVQEEDKIWFALASYNIGFGHLEDARILTQRAGKSPNHWNQVTEFLPLLTKARYYNTVKRGYARGYEPVTYVKNIRRYLELIRWEGQLSQMREANNLLSDKGTAANEQPGGNQIIKGLKSPL